MGEYNKSAVIKYTRQAKGLTQEELSEFICDPVTLSRYENGQLNPTDDKFFRLMQKMGERGDIYSFPVQCEMVGLQEKMQDLLLTIEKKNWSEVEEIKNRIEKEHYMSMEYPENRQYIGRVEIILKIRRGEISKKEAVEQFEELLKQTIAGYDKISGDIKMERMILSETEVMLLYSIATYCIDINELEKAENIFKRLRKSFLQEDVIHNEKPRYLINTNYSDLLGLTGRYDESIDICKEEIQWLLENNKTNCLFNFYFNIGWVIKKKVEEGIETKDKLRQAKCYVWIAYQLAKNYPEYQEYLKTIQEFYNQI